MSAAEPVTVLWIGEDEGAARARAQSGLMLDFHAGPVNDACISRIARGGVQVVVLSMTDELLGRLVALREAWDGVAVIAVADGDGPSAQQTLAAGAHEHMSCSELDRLAVLVDRALARVAAEKRLGEHRDRLRALFNAMSSGVIVTRPDGRVVEVNEPAIRYLELDDGSKLADVGVDDVIPGFGDLLRDTPMGVQRQAELQLPGGKQRTLGFSSTESPTGRYRFTLFRDLTPMV
ncbi:MAG: PAS domain-containing protein, partial [Myxococcota bacterium]